MSALVAPGFDSLPVHCVSTGPLDHPTGYVGAGRWLCLPLARFIYRQFWRGLEYHGRAAR